MIKIAAFIIPKKKIRDKILDLKKKIKTNFGNQPYLSHLPHCTLFTINASNKILNEKKNFNTLTIKSNFNKTLIIKKTGIFLNDPITGGKTIYFGVTKTPFLNMLQSELLKLFFKFNTSSKMKFKYNWMNKNNKRYGYPFVGKKWIPHLTIASLTSFHNKNKFIKNFLNKKIDTKELFNKVYIYKVNGDKHTYLWSINVLRK